MRLKLIRLLAVVVALVVPLQGVAAIMAGQCMALGHHQDSDSAGQESHDHAAHSLPDEAGSNAHDGESDGASHCGPCAACCASASIAGPAPLSILSDPSDPPYLFAQLPPLGVQPPGLDRPPLAL